MLPINYFCKIFVIFFIAIRCAFALHDNLIFYQAEQSFISGAFDESQHFLNQLTQDHLLKNALQKLIEKPNASNKKGADNPLKNLEAIDRTIIYIETFLRKISDNTFFLYQKHNAQDDSIELCFQESCQALYVCLRVDREYNNKKQENILINKLKEFCKLANTFIVRSTHQQLLGAQMLNTITNIFSIPHIDYLCANYLSAQYDASSVKNQRYTEYAKKLYLRASIKNEFCHNAFRCISLLYWKQLQYEQFFLWFSKSVDDTCFYSSLNTFLSKKLTKLVQSKNYVDILLLLTAYRFIYYKNLKFFKIKCKETLLPNSKIDFFKLLTKQTSLYQLNNEIPQSTTGKIYSARCLAGLYYYVIGDYCNALRHLYYAFIRNNDAQSYYYIVRLLWSKTKKYQRETMITALTPIHIPHPDSPPSSSSSSTPDPIINEQSIFFQQLSTSQLLKLATIYLTMHHYDITEYLLRYLIDNYPLCFEIISAKYLQGVMYEFGYYYEKNINIALYYYGEAASAGLPLAMHDLGRLYTISEEAPLASTWLDKAIQRKALQSPSSLYIQKSKKKKEKRKNKK